MTMSGYIVVATLLILSIIAYYITNEDDLKTACIAIIIFLLAIIALTI